MDMHKGFIIVPKVVAYDSVLNDKQKLLYGEIASLTAATWECFASNQYFAERFKCNKGTISKNISALEKANYISLSLIYKKDSKEVEKRIIVTTPSSSELISRGYDKENEKPMMKNVQDNNNKIIINISADAANIIYNHYIDSIKRIWWKYDMKYNKKALSLERIKKVAKSKKLNEEQMKTLINSYIKQNREQIKKWYAKMCQYFFWPVEKGSSVWYYEDFLNNEKEKKQEKKEKKVDFWF